MKRFYLIPFISFRSYFLGKSWYIGRGCNSVSYGFIGVPVECLEPDCKLRTFK